MYVNVRGKNITVSSNEMKSFSPFDKPLKKLVSSDLETLRSVSEGWYVEYKQAAINASSIAKRISEFANTYGGWVCFGISEKSKDEPVADAYPGIRNDELDSMLRELAIRQSSILTLHPRMKYECCEGMRSNWAS